MKNHLRVALFCALALFLMLPGSAFAKHRISVNGACGSSNGQTLASAPTTNLCDAGTASVVSGSGPWNWSCAGLSGGSTAQCSASVKVSASPSGTTIPSASRIVDSSGTVWTLTSGHQIAKNGTVDPVTANVVLLLYYSGVIYQEAGTTAPYGWWSWTSGSWAYRGTNGDPRAINGACGTSNGADLTSAPTTGLCGTGTPSSITGSGPWNWTCAGTGGGSAAQCTASLKVTALNGACGSSNGQSLSSKPSTNLCTTGTASSVTGNGPWAWDCAGSNGGTTAQCAASLKATPVNGTCGASNGESMSSAPITNLCTAGAASVVSGSGPWNWTCAGSNGGTTAQCIASLQQAVVNGVCGSINGQTLSTEPTSNLCSSGTATAVTADGSSWIWQCTGSTGGNVAGCYAYSSGGGDTCPGPTILGTFVGIPDDTSAANQAAFVANWDSFVGAMGQAPTMMETNLDFTHPLSQWVSDQTTWNVPSWQASSLANVTPLIGVPMALQGDDGDTDFRAIISGAWDATLNGVFQAWASAGHPVIYIRPGWEMNGNWYAWSVTSANAADFVAAFQHIATLAHNFSGAKITVVWTPSVPIVGAAAASSYYPGDAYVDAIGVDIYGLPLDPDTVPSYVSTGSTEFTLLDALALARAHNKPFSFGETGGIDATFPTNLADVIASSGVTVAFVNFWDANFSGDTLEWSLNSAASTAWRNAYTAIAQASAAASTGSCSGGSSGSGSSSGTTH